MYGLVRLNLMCVADKCIIELADKQAFSSSAESHRFQCLAICLRGNLSFMYIFCNAALMDLHHHHHHHDNIIIYQLTDEIIRLTRLKPLINMQP